MQRLEKHRRASDGARVFTRRFLPEGEIQGGVCLVHGVCEHSGRADRLNLVSGSRMVADRMGDRCTLRVYDGVLHQPHTDPDTPRILGDVIAWLAARARA